MKKIVIVISILALVFVAVYGVSRFMATIGDSSISMEGGSTASDANMYRNEEWGFGFEYPDGWEIREPAFGSTVSLYNFIVEPVSRAEVPDPILVNLSPKTWGESVLTKVKNQGVLIESKMIAGNDFSYHLSSDMGIPMHSYFILIDDEYWINITGKTAYETELQQVLDSFYFIE